MVATATMIEGSLDVLSCATLLQLAVLDLPASVNGAIVVFSLLELVNACQSFALQVLLSGGHDDTPLDLVKWKGESLYCYHHVMIKLMYLFYTVHMEMCLRHSHPVTPTYSLTLSLSLLHSIAP